MIWMCPSLLFTVNLADYRCMKAMLYVDNQQIEGMTTTDNTPHLLLALKRRLLLVLEIHITLTTASVLAFTTDVNQLLLFSQMCGATNT